MRPWIELLTLLLVSCGQVADSSSSSSAASGGASDAGGAGGAGGNGAAAGISGLIRGCENGLPIEVDESPGVGFVAVATGVEFGPLAADPDSWESVGFDLDCAGSARCFSEDIDDVGGLDNRFGAELQELGPVGTEASLNAAVEAGDWSLGVAVEGDRFEVFEVRREGGRWSRVQGTTSAGAAMAPGDVAYASNLQLRLPWNGDDLGPRLPVEDVSILVTTAGPGRFQAEVGGFIPPAAAAMSLFEVWAADDPTLCPITPHDTLGVYADADGCTRISFGMRLHLEPVELGSDTRSEPYEMVCF